MLRLPHVFKQFPFLMQVGDGERDSSSIKENADIGYFS